jgi:hypothetical protein
LPKSLRAFVPQLDFQKKMEELKLNSTSYASFVKRFYNWWDGFTVLKFVHFARDNFYPDVSLSRSVGELVGARQDNSSMTLLLLLREKQKKKSAYGGLPSK